MMKLNLKDSYLKPMILFSNLSIVMGVLVFQWDIFYIMFLFWFESISIGIFHFFKILINNYSPPLEVNYRSNKEPPPNRFFAAFFFLVHFNGFNLVHLVFLVILAIIFSKTNSSLSNTVGQWVGSSYIEGSSFLNRFEFLMKWLIFPIIFLNQFVAFRKYLSDRKSKNISDINPMEMMFLPYKRIFIMHFTIVIGGGISIIAMEYVPDHVYMGLGITSMFVLFKTYQDLRAKS